MSLAVSHLNALPTWLLSQASLRAHRLLQERLGEVGARGHHFRALLTLAEAGPLSQVVLGHLTGMDRRDVTVTLTELEADGHVARCPDPDDARRNVVTITTDGRTRLAELAALVGEVQDAVMEPLTPGELVLLVRILNKIQP